MAGKQTFHKLVVLGDGGVGKTALTVQFCLNHFVETYDPTIEDSYRKPVQIDGTTCMLEVLDTAGQEEYIALRGQWIRDGEGFVLVYSISSRVSFQRIQRFYDQIQRRKEDPLSSATSLPPIMLVGNKCDRVTEREVSTREGSALAKKLGCDFVEASAKDVVNVEKAFFEVVRQLRRQRHQEGGRPPNKSTRGGSTKGDRGGRRVRQGEGLHPGRGAHHGKRKEGGNTKPKCIIL